MKGLKIAAILIACGGISPIAQAQEATSRSPEEVVSEWMGSAHAEAMAEAFRHWDEDGEIPGRCAACHSTPGFVAYVNGPRETAGVIDHPVPTGSVIACESCHDPAVSRLESVLFPSGAQASFGSSAACAICHQGRAWGGDVDVAAVGMEPDAVSADLSFINVHYSAAATTLMGAGASGGYQYEGKSYAGRFEHVPDWGGCVGCHGAHDTSLDIAECTTCHAGAATFRDIRATPHDIDGDGDTSEGMGRTLADLHDRLGQAIARYAAEVAGQPIVYASAAYPYFFSDLDADGAGGEGELVPDNAYAAWTPRLLRAAYNYQFVAKDNGAYAHNPHYAAQLLIDSLEDLGQAVEIGTEGLVRP